MKNIIFISVSAAPSTIRKWRDIMKQVEKKSWSPVTIGLLEAGVTVLYITLIGVTLGNGNQIFGPVPTVFGPIIFLTLFIFSAIFCAGVMLGYPFYIFWEKKNLSLAAKIVVSSALWLLLFIILAVSFLVYLR